MFFFKGCYDPQTLLQACFCPCPGLSVNSLHISNAFSIQLPSSKPSRTIGSTSREFVKIARPLRPLLMTWMATATPSGCWKPLRRGKCFFCLLCFVWRFAMNKLQKVTKWCENQHWTLLCGWTCFWFSAFNTWSVAEAILVNGRMCNHRQVAQALSGFSRYNT